LGNNIQAESTHSSPEKIIIFTLCLRVITDSAIVNIYTYIESQRQQNKKMLALLIDPDKCRDEALVRQVRLIEQYQPHLVLVGGSLTSYPADEVVNYLKKHTSRPVVLYPGHPAQVSYSADALLFLSMISGRNPELLIGAHINAAPSIRRHQLETIPTGYMLIDGGVPTSVEYISQTRPIPANKTDIAVATAIAGELLGLKMIYMDAGSGAEKPVTPDMRKNVLKNREIPLMIGGGINTAEKLKQAFKSGADIVVTGNVLEERPHLLEALMETTTSTVF
jgi:phosphoglycerol geranylgeranyltransferase